MQEHRGRGNAEKKNANRGYGFDLKQWTVLLKTVIYIAAFGGYEVFLMQLILFSCISSQSVLITVTV